MASSRKGRKSIVSPRVLNFGEGEHEDDVEKDLEDEEKQDDGEKDPIAKEASLRKTHSQLISELKKKKASKS